jgi:hypothetical protein
MRSILEFGDLVEAAIVLAVDRGTLLVRGIDGIRWNPVTKRWENEATPEVDGSVCDAVGAALLTQPTLDEGVHRGDPFVAACLLFEPTYRPDGDVWKRMENAVFVRARNFTNGWDGLAYLGEDRASFELGVELAFRYRPLDFTIFRPQIEDRSTIDVCDSIT